MLDSLAVSDLRKWRNGAVIHFEGIVCGRGTKARLEGLRRRPSWRCFQRRLKAGWNCSRERVFSRVRGRASSAEGRAWQPPETEECMEFQGNNSCNGGRLLHSYRVQGLL